MSTKARRWSLLSSSKHTYRTAGRSLKSSRCLTPSTKGKRCLLHSKIHSLLDRKRNASPSEGKLWWSLHLPEEFKRASLESDEVLHWSEFKCCSTNPLLHRTQTTKKFRMNKENEAVRQAAGFYQPRLKKKPQNSDIVPR